MEVLHRTLKPGLPHESAFFSGPGWPLRFKVSVNWNGNAAADALDPNLTSATFPSAT
jgi:hypothetical protein